MAKQTRNRLSKRGAVAIVEIDAVLLFTPQGDVTNWTRRFSAHVNKYAAAVAPSNKRPRWSHYGKPLKATFKASTMPQPGRRRVYSGVGSSAPYSAFVDQGTGSRAGGAAYPAKVLPPSTWGGSDLYQAGRNKRRTVMIEGQRGQKYMDKAVRMAFATMRMRSYQIPAEKGALGEIVRSTPSGLIKGIVGATAKSPAFYRSLKQWQGWQDAAPRRSRARYALGRLPEGAGAGEEVRAAWREQDAAYGRRRAALNARLYRARIKARNPSLVQERDRQRTIKRAAQRQAAQADRETQKAAQAAALRAYKTALAQRITATQVPPGFRVGGKVKFTGSTWSLVVVAPNGNRVTKRGEWALPKSRK